MGEYIKLDLKWDRLKIDGKENTPEEEGLLAEMDTVWYKMNEEQIELVEKILKPFRRD